LHQLIEVKEGCETTRQIEPLARISYQRFFRRYVRLAGMTGTAHEVAGELGAVYGLPVVRIPTHRPLRRTDLGDRVHATAAEKWLAVVRAIRIQHERGRPVLVGTRSVSASEHLSALLDAEGLPHRVLNARQDREEAEIVARAGETGRITVATNMAGRGTDIVPSAEALAAGGLHVIATERHEARRIDRQLSGRGGRRGDAGSHEAITSLEDDLLRAHLPSTWLRTLARSPGACDSGLRRVAVRVAQRLAERLHSRVRRELLRTDETVSMMLAFSGRGE
jgi:preprotein translocase subunit SecA